MPGTTLPRRRVYHVIARLNIGGPAVHVSLLASRMPGSYDPVVLTGEVGPDEGDMAYYARERGVEPLIVGGLGRELKPLRDLALVWRLYRVFVSERPMIVHTHTAKAGAVGRLAAWLAGVPVIVHTFHGHVLRGYFGPWKTAVFGAIERTLARITDCVITLGENQRTEILSLGIGTPEHSSAIPLGLDLDGLFKLPRHTGTLQRALKLPPETPLAGIIARLVPIKGHQDFVAAAAVAAQQSPNLHFAIVGDGERRQELEAQVRALDLQDRVHFLGWRRDLDPVYADLDAVVLCSRNEGLPTALIEAQAAGIPVISTPVGSVAEILEDGVTGHLVPLGDTQALGARMAELANDPARARAMGARGQARMRERFGVERLVSDMDQLYSRLLTAKGLA